MVTNYAIQNGLNLTKSNMGVGQTASWIEAATLQMGLQIQICIQFGESQIQRLTCHEEFKQEYEVNYDEIFLPSSQDDHPRARVDGRKDDTPTQRSGRSHLHVPTGKLHGHGGRSSYMSTEEDPIWAKASVKNVLSTV